jgi:hypothetical protein
MDSDQKGGGDGPVGGLFPLQQSRDSGACRALHRPRGATEINTRQGAPSIALLGAGRPSPSRSRICRTACPRVGPNRAILADRRPGRANDACDTGYDQPTQRWPRRSPSRGAPTLPAISDTTNPAALDYVIQYPMFGELPFRKDLADKGIDLIAHYISETMSNTRGIGGTGTAYAQQVDVGASL